MTDSAASNDRPVPAIRMYRGSVLILVVAILGLLAVLGTVYIVVSHTEQTTTRAMSAALNLDLARDAVMNEVRTALFSATVDGHGNIAGLGDGTATNMSSRFYDYPEHNNGRATDNQNCPDEPWLARDIHLQSPSDVCFIGPVPAALQSTGYQQQNQLNVIGDPDPNFRDADACLLDYTSGAGEHYRFGVRIVDLSRMADLNTGAPSLFSDPDGEYLSSYPLNDGGVIDTSRRNLYATSFSVSDWQQKILTIEKPISGIAFFDPADELQLRTEAFFGSPGISRPAAAWPGGITGSTQDNYTTYSFTRDMRMRPSPTPAAATATLPTTQPSTQPTAPIAPPYTLTPSNATVYPPDCGPYVWPLAPAKVGINPALDGGSGLLNSIFYHARAATNIATAMEACHFSTQESRAFAVNYLTYRWSGIVPDPSISTGTAYYFPAGPSFIDDQGICIRATDSAGNLISPATSQFGSPSDLSAIIPETSSLSPPPPDNNRIYLGFLPQPFINKIAVEMQNDTSTNAPYIANVAIELYNPFPVALSLRGFTLQIQANGPAIPLDKQSVPACGYLVILQNKNQNGTLPSKIQDGLSPFVPDSPDALTPDSTGGIIILTRPYFGRVGTGPTPPATQPASLLQPLAAEIDAFPYDNLVPSSPTIAPNQSAIYFLRRSNDISSTNLTAGSSQPRWEAAIHTDDPTDGASVRQTDSPSNPLALGTPNPHDSAVQFSFDLSDRYTTDVQGGGSLTGPLRTFYNLADFNRILRMCNEIQNPNSPPQTATAPNASSSDLNRPLSQQLGRLFTRHHLDYTVGTQFPYDAQLHFDFKADPTFFQRPTQTPQRGDQFLYDARAVWLFDYLAMLDRVSDPTIDIGSGSNDINKLRIAGRINVNTAAPATLSAITNMPSGLAANIVNYRNRTDSFGNYPGKGIRTLPELLIPLTNGGTFKNLHERDAVWAAVINQCTTRSDSFAVYGYLEAIRANPTAVPPHDNNFDWYNVDSTTDDPHDGTGKKNIRIASRRWIAIIDRSWCNYPRGEPQFELPRIIAIKDLPR